MSDEKLIQDIASELDDRGKYRTDETVEKIIKLVRDSEWISVDDELPDDMDMGLTAYYENDAGEGVINCDVYLSHLGFCNKYRGEFKPMAGVTHWKPRPSPPKQP